MTEFLPDTTPLLEVEMAQGAVETLPPVVQENLSRLALAGEVGKHLVPTYMTALHMRPELQDVILNPYDSSSMNAPNYTGRAILPCDSPSGSPEITFDATSWKDYAVLMESRPETVNEIARLLEIEPDQVSPQLFSEFTLGHELGHVEDWRTKGFDPKLVSEIYNSELDTLPIPGVPAAVIISWAARDPQKAKEYIATHRDQLSPRGITTVGELVVAQEQGYRGISSEHGPDKFASAIIRETPAMRSTLAEATAQ